VPKSDQRPAVSEFSRDEVEELAKLEHERWMAERTTDGWSYSFSKDTTAKTSPYLVPWEELSEEVRELDRETVRRIPRMLQLVHLAVVRIAVPEA
jgi:hypothetical protein